jgi:hypothetical protein
MHGKLTKNGILKLKRGKKWLVQRCPFTKAKYGCGTWCPHFRLVGDEVITRIDLCNPRPLTFKSFTGGKYGKH